MDLSKKAVLSTFEVAKIVGVHHQTVNSWVRKGWLPAARTPGGHRRISREELDRFLRRHQQRVTPQPPAEEGNGHLLIVEDDEDTREMMVRNLQERFPALDVSYAIDGYDAGRKLSRKIPQLVFLDLMMPGLDGFHVLRDIRSDSRLRNCHVVVVTGYVNRENGQEALRIGADLVLTKPVDMNVLAHVVEHLVLQEKSVKNLKIPLDSVAPFLQG